MRCREKRRCRSRCRRSRSRCRMASAALDLDAEPANALGEERTVEAQAMSFAVSHFFALIVDLRHHLPLFHLKPIVCFAQM